MEVGADKNVPDRGNPLIGTPAACKSLGTVQAAIAAHGAPWFTVDARRTKKKWGGFEFSVGHALRRGVSPPIIRRHQRCWAKDKIHTASPASSAGYPAIAGTCRLPPSRVGDHELLR